MKLKIFSLLNFFSLTLGQSLDCAYSGSYQCSIILNNPQGFDNFTSIGGTHIAGRKDSNVNVLTSDSGTTLNIPSIICEKFSNLYEITLTSRGITTLTEKSFARCKVIVKINLWNNKINSIPVNLLVNNPLLQVFRIYSNNLTENLPEKLFDQTPKLNFFCNEQNPTGDFHPNIFTNLTKMDELHIDNMKINEFSVCLFKPMVNIRHLRAFGNQLKVLHQKSFPPTKNKLQYMYFQRNQIEAIDRRIFNDTRVLLTVNLAENICTNLTVTNFYVNRTTYLAALEPCFAEYDRRFSTEGSGSTCNFITHPVYGYTCELINFNVSAAIINDHPDCFSDSDVTGIIFKDSKISEIPGNIFSTFPKVKYIEAKNVGLKSGLIKNCGENLKFIDVSENSIKSLPSDAFNCKNIETIIADENCMTSIQACENTFMENLKSLKNVSLQRTACIDKEFNLLTQPMEFIRKELNKCFSWWYLG